MARRGTQGVMMASRRRLFVVKIGAHLAIGRGGDENGQWRRFALAVACAHGPFADGLPLVAKAFISCGGRGAMVEEGAGGEYRLCTVFYKCRLFQW